MSRTVWRALFLGLTALVLGLEVFAANDRDPDTEPWTDLIVHHIPGEITAAAVGALALWLVVHFGRRYYRRPAPSPTLARALSTGGKRPTGYRCPHVSIQAGAGLSEATSSCGCTLTPFYD